MYSMFLCGSNIFISFSYFLNIKHINYKFLELINGGNTIFYPKK